MNLPLEESGSAAHLVDPFLLSRLRCPDCLAPVVPTGAGISCERCGRSYALLDAGIPSLFASGDDTVEDQKTWDFFIGDNYQQIVDTTAAILAELDRVALPYCRGDVLEIGCGSGRFLSQAARQPGVGRAVGLDVSAGMLARAAAQGLGRLVHGSGNRLPFADAAFDTVASTFNSLSYIERPRGYHEIARVLRDGGTLVFDMLNYWTEYLDRGWTHFRATGRWPRHLSREYLIRHKLRDARHEVRLLEQAGFSLRSLKSLPYLPFLRRRIKTFHSWNGYLASRVGAATIFVAVKEPRAAAAEGKVTPLRPLYSAPANP